MILDLTECAWKPQHVDADVLVIGAGIVGLLMATRLRRSGLRTVVLESGARHQFDEIHPLNRVVQVGQIYSGAEHGRFRCLGGTSTRWGGALLPFRPDDIGPHTAGWNIDWDTSYEALIHYLPEVERLFRLPDGDYDTPGLLFMKNNAVPEFTPRMAKWPAFRLRNVATLLHSELRGEYGPEVWLNATVTKFVLDDARRITAVHARCPKGCTLIVCPKSTVIAAGAIESTRLLLILDRSYDDRIFSPDRVLGSYFYDHLSAPAADVIPSDRLALNKLTGFRFEGNAMRNLRFELTGATRRRFKLPAAFVHISPSARPSGGLDALRNIYRAVQQRKWPGLLQPMLLMGNFEWFARAIWWRYAHRTLLVPADASYELHLVIEQMPRRSNRITLSSEKKDAYGSPLAVIDWHVSSSDLDAYRTIYERFVTQWENSSLANLARLAGRPPEDVYRRLLIGGGIYHPGGSIRIGTGPQNGVVDNRLRTFRIPDLRVVSTAVFPSGGGANPTLMLILFALRAADDISAQFQMRSVSRPTFKAGSIRKLVGFERCAS